MAMEAVMGHLRVRYGRWLDVGGPGGYGVWGMGSPQSSCYPRRVLLYAFNLQR
ncbi:unnamed protein product [Ilex paraguariensis]|uniref:Uncharacterized protein n=1 Tax=Ilex paraguariensis TaxID=185542 RepID=A0ABC8UDI6_9AQUA